MNNIKSNNSPIYGKLFLIVLAAILTAQSISASIRLPQLISHGMVLQRDTELKIWGWADSGEKITVRFLGKYYDTVADNNGDWFVMLPPQKHGGPYIMEINEITIRDILIGDVWLCSGQSNMEAPMPRLLELFPEITVANNRMIRHYKVPSVTHIEGELDDIKEGAKWLAANPLDVLNWTGVAYFFAQKAYEEYGIPIGMLNSSVGGTPIEGWVSQEHLKHLPKYTVDLAVLDSIKNAMIANMPPAPTPPVDKGSGKWFGSDVDESDWKVVTVPGLWKDRGLNVNGVVWFRKSFEVPASMAGKHARLYVGTIVNSDSTYVNDKFVGTVSYQYPPRKYDVLAGTLREGTNTVTIKMTDYSGNGGFIEDKPYKLVCNDEEIDLTGEWKYKVGAEIVQTARPSGNNANIGSRGSGYYNAMISPITDYKVKGAIWYQGESNAGRPGDYEQLLEALISNWRSVWNMPDMPFILVQLPNFMKPAQQPSESGWARIREAQLNASLKIPNTAMAVTIDVGEWNDIHPLNKKDVGHRVFLSARKLAYGEKDLVSSGPVFKEMKIEGNKIILSFTNVGSGLSGALKQFAIAGSNKKFVWADAEIVGDKVIVTSKSVKKPVAVRYAWSDNPEGASLQNKEGLLASPFRTDNW